MLSSGISETVSLWKVQSDTLPVTATLTDTKKKRKKSRRFLQQVIKTDHPEMLAFLPATALKIEKNIAVLKFINFCCVFVETACLIFFGLFTHISKLATFDVVLMTNEGSPSESTTLTLSVKKCLRDDDYRKWVSKVMDSNISQ